MTIIQSIILGIVQGLTELLPISSSAHLYVIPWIFNWKIPESFDIALHFGTLLAIVIFFFEDWLNLIKGGVDQLKGQKTKDGKMFWYIVIATIPGGIIGFLLDHFLDGLFKNPIIVAISLIIMGITLYLVDINSKNKTKYEELNFKQTFLVGVSQCLAFIPGISRSGITMTTGRSLGIEREAIAKYSFMLSTPIIFAATIFKLKEFSENVGVEFFLGVFTSFITGVIAIKFLLEYLKKRSFKSFAIYRIIIGLTVMLIYFIK